MCSFNGCAVKVSTTVYAQKLNYIMGDYVPPRLFRPISKMSVMWQKYVPKLAVHTYAVHRTAVSCRADRNACI